MAGRGADEGRRKLPGSGRGNPSRQRPEARPRGLKSPQWSAERRASVTTEATRLARRVGRLRQPSRRPRKPPRFSALRSLKGAQDGRRRTRRRKEYGRRSVGYLKFESDEFGRRNTLGVMLGLDPGIYDETPRIEVLRKFLVAELLHGLPGQARQ